MSSGDTKSSSQRITSIDALRGLVMLLMLVDHAREFFYLHAQVADPMELSVTPPALVLTRFTAHLCAPVFVLLTGLATSLYAVKHGGRGAASAFLLKCSARTSVTGWALVLRSSCGCWRRCSSCRCSPAAAPSSGSSAAVAVPG